MYIWVVLATFVVALLSYNLSVRSDSKELYVEPQAEAVASKLYVQHNALHNMYANRIYYNFANEPNTPMVFFNTTGISDADVASAMQTFSRVPGGRRLVGNHSAMYCVKNDPDSADFFKSGALAGAECNNGRDVLCCSGMDSDGHNFGQIYLVSYAPIPVRWQSKDESGRRMASPNADLRDALKNFASKDMPLGYLTKEGGKYYIRGFNKEEHQLPTSIGNTINGCGYEEVANGTAFCLIQMSKLR